MGLIDSIRNTFSGSSTEDDSEWEEDPMMEEMDMEGEGFEWEDEDEPEEVEEWDSAYQCHDEYIQYQGFSGSNEFIARFLAMKIKSSDEFRDRIRIGKETANMVRSTVSDLESIREGSGSTGNMGELAEQVEEANKLKREMEEFTDKDEQAYASGIITANRAIDAVKKFAESDTSIPDSIGGRVEESDDKI